MSTDKILDRIQKLLRLARNNPNINESAAAAAAAQKLLDEHNLSESALDGLGSVFDEPVEKMSPLDKSQRVPRWKVEIALTLQKMHPIRVFFSGRTFVMIGRKSDKEIVQAFYDYLCEEVVILTKINAYGNGHTYANNYSIGCAVRLSERLLEHRLKWQQENDPNSMALAVVDRKKEKVEDMATNYYKIQPKKSTNVTKFNASARSQGYVDGNRIPINKMVN